MADSSNLDEKNLRDEESEQMKKIYQGIQGGSDKWDPIKSINGTQSEVLIN